MKGFSGIIAGTLVLGWSSISHSGTGVRSVVERSGAISLPSTLLLIPVYHKRVMCADEALIKAVNTISDAAPKISQVWPGYWPSNQAFILTDPGKAILLYTSAESPPGFEPLRSPSSFDSGSGITYVKCGTLPDLSASRGNTDIEYPIGETIVTAVPLQSNLASTLSFLYHEAFHAYQQKAFQIHELDLAVDEDVISLEYQALAEVERHILAEALGEANLQTTRELIIRYLSVRRRRMALVPLSAQEVERHLERVEGSARLVGETAMLIALDSSTNRLSDLLRDELANPPTAPPFGAHWEIRVRAYAAGAAIGVLLDRLGYEWRSQVEQGDMLDTLLSKATKLAPTAVSGVEPATSLEIRESP